MKKDLCPLWGLPEMAPANLILPDWLHAVDQGCGADMVGQILVELAEAYPCRSFKLRIDALWEDIQILYKEYNIEYKLTNLCPEVLNKGKGSTGPPTLKCQAAVMRHLVQILPLLTAKHFSGGSKHQQACHKLARFLTESYTAMETTFAPLQCNVFLSNKRPVSGRFMEFCNSHDCSQLSLLLQL